MTFPPEPLVQIQNNFTEMFLMMASTTRDETKNMHVTVCMLAILHVLLRPLQGGGVCAPLIPENNALISPSPCK